jgi:hypothetical protein
MYTRSVRFVTGRVSARAVIPDILELLATGCDLARRGPGRAVGPGAVGVAGDDR